LVAVEVVHFGATLKENRAQSFLRKTRTQRVTRPHNSAIRHIRAKISKKAPPLAGKINGETEGSRITAAAVILIDRI
jgi:hypothetical protein